MALRWLESGKAVRAGEPPFHSAFRVSHGWIFVRSRKRHRWTDEHIDPPEDASKGSGDFASLDERSLVLPDIEVSAQFEERSCARAIVVTLSLEQPAVDAVRLIGHDRLEDTVDGV